MSIDYRHRRFSNHRPARHGHRTAREKAKQGLRFADGLWGDHPSAERGPRAESRTAGPQDFGVRRQSYRRVNPGSGCPAGVRRVREPRTPPVRLGREEVMLWEPGTRPKSARLSLVGDEVIPARCKIVVMARLGAPVTATQRPH